MYKLNGRRKVNLSTLNELNEKTFKEITNWLLIRNRSITFDCQSETLAAGREPLI